MWTFSLSHRSSILWVKGNKRIPVGKRSQRVRRKRRRRKHINRRKKDVFSGNAFVTRKGTLQIRKTETKDKGIYTCMGKFTVIISYLYDINSNSIWFQLNHDFNTIL